MGGLVDQSEHRMRDCEPGEQRVDAEHEEHAQEQQGPGHSQRSRRRGSTRVAGRGEGISCPSARGASGGSAASERHRQYKPVECDEPRGQSGHQVTAGVASLGQEASLPLRSSRR